MYPILVEINGVPVYAHGFFLNLALRNHPRMQDGNLLKFGLGGYAVFRFFVEFVRNTRVVLWGLTGQQWACVLLLSEPRFFGSFWQSMVLFW